MQSAGDVWGRDWNDKVACGLDFAIDEFGLEEAFLFPPVIPCRLDDFWNVCFAEDIVQRLQDLLLPLWSLLHILGNLLDDGFRLLLLGLCSWGGVVFLLLFLELAKFLSFGSVAGNYENESQFEFYLRCTLLSSRVGVLTLLLRLHFLSAVLLSAVLSRSGLPSGILL